MHGDNAIAHALCSIVMAHPLGTAKGPPLHPYPGLRWSGNVQTGLPPRDVTRSSSPGAARLRAEAPSAGRYERGGSPGDRPRRSGHVMRPPKGGPATVFSCLGLCRSRLAKIANAKRRCPNICPAYSSRVCSHSENDQPRLSTRLGFRLTSICSGRLGQLMWRLTTTAS